MVGFYRDFGFCGSMVLFFNFLGFREVLKKCFVLRRVLIFFFFVRGLVIIMGRVNFFY